MMRILMDSKILMRFSWSEPFVKDFRTRFVALLAGSFRNYTPSLALSILDPKLELYNNTTSRSLNDCDKEILMNNNAFTTLSLKRLQSYSNNLIDYHVVLDLVPPLTRTFFSERHEKYTIILISIKFSSIIYTAQRH